MALTGLPVGQADETRGLDGAIHAAEGFDF